MPHNITLSYYIAKTLLLLGDVIIFHFTALTYLRGDWGGKLIAFISLSSVALSISVNKFYPRLIRDLPVSSQFKLAVRSCSLGLLPIGLLCFTPPETAPVALSVIAILLFRLAAHFNTLLMARIPLLLHDAGCIGLSRQRAIEGLLFRLSYAAAPGIILTLTWMSWENWSWTAVICWAIGTSSLYLAYKQLQLHKVFDAPTHSAPSASSSNSDAPNSIEILPPDKAKRLQDWAIVVQTAQAIAFNGIGICLLYIASQGIYFGSPLITPTAGLYSGVILTNLLIIFQWLSCDRSINRLTLNAVLLCSLTSVLIIAAGTGPSWVLFACLVLAGGLNTFSGLMMQSVVPQMLPRDQLTDFTANMTISLRLGNLISMSFFGFLVDLKPEPTVPLIICGLAGTLAALSITVTTIHFAKLPFGPQALRAWRSQT